MKYWHFLHDDGCLRYGSKEKVKIKHTLMLPVNVRLVLCETGFHASKRAIDALQYAPGSLVCLVTLHGKIIHDTDKSVAQGRTVLAMADATNVLHEMACRCAEQALSLIPNPDPRSVAAIAAKRAWLKGEITNEQLSAAWAAARDAAGAAAWDAARGAARGAAGAAARDAARDAAWAAARGAAGAAARGAARGAQNTMLEKMLYELLDAEIKKEKNV